MLNALPRASERIFPTTYKTISVCFWKLRHRAAKNLQNPRLLNISLTTIEEAKELLATGFDYVTEMNGIKLFRNPK